MTAKTTTAERRSGQRVRLRKPPLLNLHSGSSSSLACILNVSKTGCFLNTTGNPAVGDSVWFEVALPSRKVVRLNGTVIHYQHPKLTGVGVQFKRLSTDARKYLNLLIAGHAE